jgi:ubiquitin carboxyl-terminal hydrolase 4/11/15
VLLRRLSRVETHVDNPETMKMREFIAGPQRNSDQHSRLYAVCNHYGGMGGGHDTAKALVQDPFGEADPKAVWDSFDDSSASPSSRDVHAPAGDVLFYERCNP